MNRNSKLHTHTNTSTAILWIRLAPTTSIQYDSLTSRWKTNSIHAYVANTNFYRCPVPWITGNRRLKPIPCLEQAGLQAKCWTTCMIARYNVLESVF